MAEQSDAPGPKEMDSARFELCLATSAIPNQPKNLGGKHESKGI
jgi:hypothetical protein